MPDSEIPSGLLAENRKFEIEAVLGETPLPLECHVTLNDVPVDRVTRRGKTIFPIEFDFYAGNLRVAVVSGRKVMASINLEVDPDIAKISREDYAAMVSDVARSTLALYRLGDLTVPAAVTPAGIRSDLVTLDLVRSNFNAFERAVSRIAGQPLRTLFSSRSNTNVLKARRIDDRAIDAALRSGKSRTATPSEARAAPRLVAAVGGQWIPEVTERRSKERTDIFENRALLGFMSWLDMTLSDMSRRLSVGSSDVNPATAVLWLDRLGRWRARLARTVRRGIFTDLQPEPALRATNAFRMHPDYASAFSAMVRMKSGLGTGAAVAPAIPIDRTYSLYETWCYVGLLHAAAEKFPTVRPAVSILLQGCAVPNALGTILAQGYDAQLSLGDGITLTYQRRFTTKPGDDGSRTLVVDAIPDVTFARTNSEGLCTGIVLLDPKYRAGSSLADGIRELHVYRDSIVGRGNDRIVISAVALTPRPGSLLTTSTSFPTHAPAAVEARPGHDPLLFRRLLHTAISALR